MASLPSQVSAQVPPALRLGARAGYAARGVVYLVVGLLVLWSLRQGTGSAPSSEDALAAIADSPAGAAGLWLLAIALAAFALWRLVQALRDTDHHGTDARGLAMRAALLASALLHGALAWTAANMARCAGSGAGGQGWTAELMAQPWGRWLVGLLGVAVIVAGTAQFVKGWKGGFLKRFDVDRARLGTLYTVCRIGLMARGVVFGIIGWLLLDAAIAYQPAQDGGLRGAFTLLLQQPHGMVLLGLAGIGMLAFAVYSFVEARHRRVLLR
jgi:hypothetical protein